MRGRIEWAAADPFQRDVWGRWENRGWIIYVGYTHSIWMNVRHQDRELALSFTVGLRETQDELTGQAEAHQGGERHGIHGAICFDQKKKTILNDC